MPTADRCLGCYRPLATWLGHFCSPLCERLWVRRRRGSTGLGR
jgi:hypothetical protein